MTEQQEEYTVNTDTQDYVVLPPDVRCWLWAMQHTVSKIDVEQAGDLYLMIAGYELAIMHCLGLDPGEWYLDDDYVLRHIPERGE